MRYIMGLLLGIGLIVLTFILIFKAFSGSDTPKTQQIDLNSYATTNAVMRLTMEGPIVADSKFSRVRITVGSDQVLYEQLQGYEGNVVNSKTYPSNPEAYANFLHALTLQNFTKGDATKPKDSRGYCPQGRRYTYEALSGGDNIFRWWNDSCTVNDGSFLGSGQVVRQLFVSQVPDYYTLTRNVSL